MSEARVYPLYFLDFFCTHNALQATQVPRPERSLADAEDAEVDESREHNSDRKLVKGTSSTALEMQY